MTICGGTYTLSTGDDGMHADEENHVSGGEITIETCYEGIEGQNVEISGGTIDITASDDGLNAAGGNDQSGMGGFGGDMFSQTGMPGSRFPAELSRSMPPETEVTAMGI